jgi:hypothetical protein
MLSPMAKLRGRLMFFQILAATVMFLMMIAVIVATSALRSALGHLVWVDIGTIVVELVIVFGYFYGSYRISRSVCQRAAIDLSRPIRRLLLALPFIGHLYAMSLLRVEGRKPSPF